MRKKILIVDDEPDVLTVMGAIIRVLGHEVLLVDNAQDAINTAREKKPDLILLDIHMPEMGGLEACRIMKDDIRIRDIPVVFVTASTSNIESKKDGTGANGYITKPFQNSDLINTVQDFLNNKI